MWGQVVGCADPESEWPESWAPGWCWRLAVQAGDTIDDLFTLCKADVTTRNPKRAEKYVRNYDIGDVLENIVVPINVLHSLDFHDHRFNLFQVDDYTKLTPAIVANSCAWHDLWVSDAFIRENMT